MQISLLPIDVGFCPKKARIPVVLNDEITSVKYLDANNQEQSIFHGSDKEIAETLTLSGYKVVYKVMPNGREMRCELRRTNLGEKVIFAAQPENDNYWIESNSPEELENKIKSI